MLEPLQELLATSDDACAACAACVTARCSCWPRVAAVATVRKWWVCRSGGVRQLDADTWLYALYVTKPDTGGVRRETPLRGPAAQALFAWLADSPADSGPLFAKCIKATKLEARPIGR